MTRVLNPISDALLQLVLMACVVLAMLPRDFTLWLRGVLAAVLLIVVCGCSNAPIIPTPADNPPPPTAALCDPACTAPCVGTWPRWTAPASDPAAWDALGHQVIAPLRVIAEACDIGRAACVACLRRLELTDPPLLCGVTVECPSG